MVWPRHAPDRLRNLSARLANARRRVKPPGCLAAVGPASWHALARNRDGDRTDMTGTALILGASGHFGAHAERAFEFAGWTTRRYSRGTDMSQAARGVDIIVNGLNPPNYHAWDRLIPEITSTVLAAAAGSGATVLVPGNVYVFGRQPAPWS